MALEEQIEKAMQLEKFNDECANRKINDMHANFVQMSGENDKRLSNCNRIEIIFTHSLKPKSQKWTVLSNLIAFRKRPARILLHVKRKYYTS